ncbi:MAG: hemerythrin domain-containing protein [Candidatus Binatia bacterium]
MLIADHEKVENLFRQYEGSQDWQNKAASVEKACSEFEIHAQLEEEIFYPTLRAQADEEGKELVGEGIHEHNAARDSIKELQGLSPNDAEYDRTFQQFMQCVRHYVEEEKNEMFPLAAETLGEERNKRIGLEMQQRKQQLMTSGASHPAEERRAFQQNDSEVYAPQ